jgi:signal recognition particle receptor subunit beta
MTSAGVGVDDNRDVPGKTTTTVAMDFGRISIDQDLILYLFGTPGQTRFWFMWDELVRGAIGAVVLVDTRRLADCFAAIDFFEHRRLPYLVAINCFDGVQLHSPNDVREALAIGPGTPVITCDARSRESTKHILITLVESVLSMRRSRPMSEATDATVR